MVDPTDVLASRAVRRRRLTAIVAPFLTLFEYPAASVRQTLRGGKVLPVQIRPREPRSGRARKAMSALPAASGGEFTTRDGRRPPTARRCEGPSAPAASRIFLVTALPQGSKLDWPALNRQRLENHS